MNMASKSLHDSAQVYLSLAENNRNIMALMVRIPQVLPSIWRSPAVLMTVLLEAVPCQTSFLLRVTVQDMTAAHAKHSFTKHLTSLPN